MKAKTAHGQNFKQSVEWTVEKIAVAAKKLTRWSTLPELVIELFSHLNLFPSWGKVSRWQILTLQAGSFAKPIGRDTLFDIHIKNVAKISVSRPAYM